MDISDIGKNYPIINAAADDMLKLFGPEFTNTPGGHVETDIAAAASLAGLLILRGKGFDLGAFKPGTVFLSDIDTEMDGIWNFMTAVAGNVGMDPESGWDEEIPDENKPMYSVPEMTRKTEKKVIAICGKHKVKPEFFPYVAVLAALKLVYSADKLHILDQNTGKALTGYHVIAGAKTIPYP